MTEPVSNIVTLVTVSLAIIKATATFIQEAKVVDESIRKLLIILLDLRRLIKTVDSACRRATSREDDPSHFVKDALTRCRSRLEEVQHMVENLASKSSRTFLQKVALNVRTNRSKKDIDDSIKDIERLMDQIHKGISCWNLHMTSIIDRRTSEALSVTQSNAGRFELPQIAENESISPLARTWSEAETAYEYDMSVPHRLASSSTHNSISSTSTSSRLCQSRPSQNNSAIADIKLVKENSDWVDFHYQIKVCDGNDARIDAIKAVLQQHSEGSMLANSRDASERSPLHWAAQRGDVKLAQILLGFSANINAKDSQPCSVLDLAVEHNQEAFVEFLLVRHVDETGISKQNSLRFEEMKQAIEWRKRKYEKRMRRDEKHARNGEII
ncbi:hypothetical protein CC78DRAFT_212356 [Lojkania enalia]|uniref:Ankyrin repeat protein n=1 Tax=Lojkania enalia TaxID=147567 RepID=A0A9P4N6S5_9PLEO|nr:hypothetical protein CC78DRAFT_212356 [Didymosphaeria enalia]